MPDNERLKTSQEVYNRIRWDSRFDPSKFVIGYETRDQGMCEIALEDFDRNGDIPWHRIWYFRDDKTFVWDRRTRLDLIFGSGQEQDAPRAPQSPLKAQAAPEVAEVKEARRELPLVRQAFSFQGNGWKTASEKLPPPAKEGEGKDALKVVTYNVLSGPDEAENMALNTRIEALCKILSESNADLIALQEVSAEWRDALLQYEPLRQYQTTLFPGEELRMALFSRYPLTRVLEHRFTQEKRSLLCEVASPFGTLVVVVTHLTSNRQARADEKRAAQWRWLQDDVIGQDAAALSGAKVILLGDFNAGEEESSLWEPAFLGKDVWSELRPLEDGFTFDPMLNSLARLTSTKGLRGRLDRIFARGFVVKEVSLLGLAAIGEERGITLFPSDHYGLATTLTAELVPSVKASIDWSKEEPTYRSALIVSLPLSQWGGIQEIRAQYDPAYPRWMPHINMVYGFVAERSFEAASERLREALREVEPFEVSLQQVKVFSHPGSTTVYLAPNEESKQRLIALQRTVEALFPLCNEQGQKSPQGFTPHMTIAKLKKAKSDAVSSLQASWQKKLLPCAFPVDGLYLISRRTMSAARSETANLREGLSASVEALLSNNKPALLSGRAEPRSEWKSEDPFEARFFVPFGKTSKTLPKKHQEAHRLMQETASAVLSQGGPITLTGSAQFKSISEASDLDLLSVGPASLSHEEFFEGVRSLLEEHPNVRELRLIKDALFPLLKAEIEGVSTDLVYARTSTGTLSGEALDARSKAGLAGYQENQAIVDAARLRFRGQELQELLSLVAAWARKRQIYGNRVGYLGGFSWAVLVSSFLGRQKSASVNLLSLAKGFFTEYAAWSWPTPVSLSEEAALSYQGNENEPMPILTPLSPARNSARNICRSTLEVIREEMKRAATLLSKEGASLSSLSEAYQAPANQASLRVTLVSADSEQEGLLESRLVGLYVLLEKALQATVRPLYSVPEGKDRTWRILLKAFEEKQATTAVERFIGSLRVQAPQLTLRYQLQKSA